MKNSYREKAKHLKKLGLVNYDLRKELSTGQKAQITKLAQTWGHYINHPEQFHKARVSQRTAKELKGAGFKVTPKNVAVVPLYEYSKAKIEKDRIIYENAAGLREETYIVDHKNFLPQLNSLSQKKLPRNSMVTVRIGDRAEFGQKFKSWHELYKYLQDWEPRDPGADKSQLIALMSVVTINDRRKYAKKKGAGKGKRRS